VIVYRFAAHGTPLRTVPASQPGRYNLAAQPDPTQYLALHPLGPLAELMRSADLRTPEQIRAVRTRTWALDVNLEELPEVTFETADEYEISAEELVSDDYRACQDLAGRLRGQVAGLIAPSAALPGTRNAILFGPRVSSPYLTGPVSELDVPASITAEDGRPLESLAAIVRFKGDTDPALHAWQRDAEFRFAEPTWALTP
jgi:hypothetical protein